MLWTLILFSIYTTGRILSQRDLRAILTRTRPQHGANKNTYMVRPARFHKLKILQYFNKLPVQIVSVNGQRVRNPFFSLNLPSDAILSWATTNSFGTSYQITEYLDSKTQLPAITLMPNNQIMSSSGDVYNDLSRLSLATRRDLQEHFLIKEK